MLFLFLVGCGGEMQDFRGGWTEIECDADNRDSDGWILVEVDEAHAGPRPVSIALTVEDGLVQGALPYDFDRTLMTITNDTNVTACRVWVAE